MRHIVEYDSYNGWMALGDIGGFAFFMMILHTMVMMCIGVCFNNDSQFLGGRGQE